jgi:hypothetical protein
VRRVEVVTVPVVGRSTFSVGSAMSQGFSIWARNVVFFFGLSILAELPAGLLSPQASRPLTSSNTWTRILLWVGGLTVSGILAFVVQGLVTYSVLEQLRGRTPPLGEALAKGWSRAWLLFVVAFSTGLLLFAATLALVIPAIVLATHWALISQVVVAEGDVDARDRSAQLTVGHRWPIFGVLVLFWFASMGLRTLANQLVGGPRSLWVMMLGYALPTALVLSVSAVVYTVVYYQLRSEKEGVDLEQLTSVFR